jgi:hypothetical protein
MTKQEAETILSSMSQGSYGEERDLVRKWLPAFLIGFCLSQVDIGDKTKLTELKGGPWLSLRPYQLPFVADIA